jgi:hypothetical protein
LLGCKGATAPSWQWFGTAPSHASALCALRPAGDPGSWDEVGVGHPVVRYYLGDNEQRWYMWYTGRSAACPDLDAIFPSSGSVGAGRCGAGRGGAALLHSSC